MTHTHKKSRFGLVTGVSILTALMGLAPSAHAQFGSISESDEIAAGKEVVRQAIKEYGNPVSASDPRQRRVSRLGAIFARDAKRKNIPYTFTVLDNNKVLNAFSAPGGPVVLTTKIVDTASNDAELAFVVAHEVGHVENKHAVKQAQRQSQVGLAAGLLGALLGRGSNGNTIGTLGGVAVSLWSSGYSRDQENQADSYSVRALARNGFDPRAAVTMLGKLGSGPSGLDKYLATHPAPQKRQTSVNNLIQKESLLALAQRSGGAFLNLSGNNSTGYAPTYTSVLDNAVAYSTAAVGGNDGNNAIDLRTVSSGNYQVVLAPINSLAQYAGGSTRTDGSQITVSRQGASATFALGSSVAILNGQKVRLSAAARLINNRFYAPLGTLVAGLKGTASYNSKTNQIHLDFGSGRIANITL